MQHDEIKVGFVNIYAAGPLRMCTGMYADQQLAFDEAKSLDGYIATASVVWHEPAKLQKP